LGRRDEEKNAVFHIVLQEILDNGTFGGAGSATWRRCGQRFAAGHNYWNEDVTRCVRLEQSEVLILGALNRGCSKWRDYIKNISF
jgi:hypothetical protein